MSWVIEEAPTLANREDEGTLKETKENLLNAIKVSSPLMEFSRVIRKGRQRLENAAGRPDELTQRRLEKSTQLFEELREEQSA